MSEANMLGGKSAAVCCECGDIYPPKRLSLGYRTCLPCGDNAAKQVKHTTAPLNKSNYVVVSNPAELSMLNPKRVGE